MWHRDFFVKINLKLDNCQGDINLRRKRGKMINEENKYLAQSDESDSEYREQQKKEDELYSQLRANGIKKDEIEKNSYNLKNSNEDFFEMSFKNKSILNTISERLNEGEKRMDPKLKITIDELRSMIIDMERTQQEFVDDMRKGINRELTRLQEEEDAIRKELINIGEKR